jgi:DNA-binding MarR family transcriptional regulator
VTVAKQVWERFTEVSRAAKASTERRLSGYNVHVGQQFVLECLWQEDGLTPSELSRRIGVEAATLTRALSRMEAARLVHREPDPRDRRRIRTWLTDTGRELREPITREMADLQAEAVALLSPEEARQLVELLGRMGRSLRGESAT